MKEHSFCLFLPRPEKIIIFIKIRDKNICLYWNIFFLDCPLNISSVKIFKRSNDVRPSGVRECRVWGLIPNYQRTNIDKRGRWKVTLHTRQLSFPCLQKAVSASVQLIWSFCLFHIYFYNIQNSKLVLSILSITIKINTREEGLDFFFSFWWRFFFFTFWGWIAHIYLSDFLNCFEKEINVVTLLLARDLFLIWDLCTNNEVFYFIFLALILHISQFLNKVLRV